MMKINKKAFLSAGTALAVLTSAGFSGAADIDVNTAKMQAMDKITGRVSVIEVPVNGETRFGSFSIVVRSCKTRPAEETPENKAFVDVVDNYDSEHPVNIFKGWMFSSSPAANAIEHPIYDVWLLKCYDGNLAGKLLTKEELAKRDEIEQIRADKKPSEKKESAVEDKQPIVQEKQVEETALAKPVIQEDKSSQEVVEPSDISETDENKDGPQQLITIDETTEATPPAPIVEEKAEKEEIAQQETEVIKVETPLVSPENTSVGTEEVAESQLIDLSEEVQEDEFELNVEALQE